MSQSVMPQRNMSGSMALQQQSFVSRFIVHVTFKGHADILGLSCLLSMSCSELFHTPHLGSLEGLFFGSKKAGELAVQCCG